ncbi:uncharacterized protein ARMOST_07573 [Armillaria ostoyae]|uniref:Uncharacterized protein n=1 Tax=Armillaria ostoyae TaxID=47428 RepID=A0A284R698_ARMOS|nr:uncharacterized protein ARMOST_07573 [Armillaria ostoyae]
MIGDSNSALRVPYIDACSLYGASHRSTKNGENTSQGTVFTLKAWAYSLSNRKYAVYTRDYASFMRPIANSAILPLSASQSVALNGLANWAWWVIIDIDRGVINMAPAFDVND